MHDLSEVVWIGLEGGYSVMHSEMGTVCAEMSSWRDLTRNLGRKTTFLTKYMKFYFYYEDF